MRFVLLIRLALAATPFHEEGGGNYLLQTATSAIKAEREGDSLIDVDSTTETTTTTTPGRYSGAGIVPRAYRA